MASGLACATSSDQSSATPPADDKADPTYGGSVVMAVADESTGWMPQKDRWGTGPINVARAVYDPMVVVGEDGQFHPWLAESFTPQDGNKTWLIAIRKGIIFTNGEPVDAHAVVYNLQAHKASALSTFAFKPVLNIEKADDYTVKVTLDQPWGSFPAVFTGQAGFVIAPEMLRDNISDKAIGSGPFVLQSWKRDAELVAKKNDKYWRKDTKGRQLPYLNEVKFRPTPDENSRHASLAAGDINLFHTNAPKSMDRLLKGQVEKGTKFLVDKSQSDEMVIAFNTQSGIASDERLRKALQYATDRRALAAQYDDAFPPADGPFTEDSPWWAPSGQPEVDLDRAKQLISEYQRDHPGPVKIRLAVTATPEGRELAQLVQNQWAAAGVEAAINAEEVTKFSATLIGGTFDALLFQFWNGEDPDVNYHFWAASSINEPGAIALNFPRWTSPEFEQALNTGRAETDQAKRKEAYATLWKQFAEHVPFIFIFHTRYAILYLDTVHGIDQVNLPDGSGRAQPITWGSINLSNTWIERR